MTRAIAVLTPTLVHPFNPVYDEIDGKYVVNLQVWHLYDGRRGSVTIPYESWKHQYEMLVFNEDVRWFD